MRWVLVVSITDSGLKLWQEDKELTFGGLVVVFIIINFKELWRRKLKTSDLGDAISDLTDATHTRR